MQKPLERLKVLDLFSGLEGWSAGFRDRGHSITTLDLDPRFGADIQADILSVNGLGKFDVILASPPCETFSVMTIGHYWTGGVGAYQPKNDKSRLGLALMNKTFDLMEKAQPRFYVVENPRGVMRKVAPRPPTTTTWYCRWGKTYAKPTDLWTNIQGEFPACRNNQPDHSRAPRGSRTGIQGDGGDTWAADARDRRLRLLAGEEVPGYKLVTSQDDDNRRGRLIVVRTGSKMKAIDGCDDNAVRHDYQPAGYRAKKAAGVLGGGVQMDASPKKAALRAIIPYRLSLAVALACERGGVLPPMDEVLALEQVYRAEQQDTEAA